MKPRSPGAFLEPDRGVLVWKNQIDKRIAPEIVPHRSVLVGPTVVFALVTYPGEGCLFI